MRHVLSVVILSLLQPLLVHSHGRLIEPPSRASAWRYGFDTPHNYNDHELYCGGFTRQWVQNEGKCGVCGDAWDAKSPRAHEYGGTYGQGVIVRKYGVGSIINIRVELTANHNGFFEFRLCPDYKTTTQECLDKNVLKLVKPQDDVDHRGIRYFPKEGNKVYEMKYRLPKRTCEHCVLQWKYIAGNNWGNCPNGTGAVGCGPQEEFRACADITIAGKGTESPLLPDITTTPTSITTITDQPAATTPEPEASHSPITALVISIVTFLLVFLTLSLFYFHFYRVGNQVKSWIKGGDLAERKRVAVTPLPPPRGRRITRGGRDDLYDVNLKGESLA